MDLEKALHTIFRPEGLHSLYIQNEITTKLYGQSFVSFQYATAAVRTVVEKDPWMLTYLWGFQAIF